MHNLQYSSVNNYSTHSSDKTMYGTTVIAVKKDGKIAIGSDGQVTLGHTVVKHTAKKIRRIDVSPNTKENKSILVGFAGSTADAFTLFDRFEGKVKEFKDDLRRAAVELAKDWRTEKILRHLEAMMIVCDKDTMLMLSGVGDVIEPEHSALAIGSGGQYAYAAARAMLLCDVKLEAKEIVKKSLEIAGEICIYTNDSITVEEV